ncbi:hypothetical protein PAXINDRAFT_21863 [Paxillus involutus ATCC 200175]|uniref:Uncharacterized protein n=1 Tax=Paxillus involutus ATCC 200175 TaxID=664439 RepID=A0A0C9T083_PAXIN|nr:hypothetical protein PAXINDRAFT_21863 [Paxillus involutus ATCC 200175]
MLERRIQLNVPHVFQSPHSTWWHGGSRSGGAWAAPNGHHKRSLSLGAYDRMRKKSRQSSNW